MTGAADEAAGVRVRRFALEILSRVESGAWSDRLLQTRERQLRDARDRRLLHKLVFETLRWQLALDPLLAAQLKPPLAELRPPVRAGLRLALAQVLVLEQAPGLVVSPTVSAVRGLAGAKGAGLVNAVLRRLLARSPRRPPPAHTLPGWLLDRWTRRWGAPRLAQIAASLTEPSRPFVVAAPERGGRDQVAARLAEEGVETRPAAYHPWGLTVLRGAPQTSPLFRAGDFVLLDEAAALVTELCRGATGAALDLAAAPGGKATLLSHVHEGPLVALELVPSRAARLKENLERRAGSETATLIGDGRRAPFPDGGFGLVLLDAPCSGTGTLRSRPEKRLRLGPVDIRRSARLQTELLDEAARLVGPGGLLVYAVCSIEAEEGREQLAAFLERHADFEALDPRPCLQPAAAELVSGSPPALEILPDVGGMDGFFAARLRRRN